MKISEKIARLRKEHGLSQEELAERLSVSRQSVSKWESDAAIPEVDKILALSEIFGVSTDYLLKDTEDASKAEDSMPTSKSRTVTSDEASGYLSLSKKASRIVSLGVFLCIIAIIPLLLIGTMMDAEVIQISEPVGTAISLGILLTLVAVAVALFVFVGIKFSAYSYLEENFELEPQCRTNITNASTKITKNFTVGVITGISIIILSLIPFLTVAILNISSLATMIALCAMLVCVGIAVTDFICVGLPKGAVDKLLCLGDYSKEKRKVKKSLESFSEVYWPAVVAIYLAYSFMTSNWGRSWIIWPIAAILFAVIEVALTALKKER